MKVSAIDKKVSKNGKDYWLISFEGAKMNAFEWESPSYKIGDDVQTTVDKSGEKWKYVVQKGAAETKPEPKSEAKVTKPEFGDRDDAIMLQVAFKGAVELSIPILQVKPSKVDTQAVIDVTRELYAGLLLLRSSVTREKK